MKSSYRTMADCGVFDSDISSSSPLPIRPVNEDMRVAVAERKAKLLQDEIYRLKEDLSVFPFGYYVNNNNNDDNKNNNNNNDINNDTTA
jgi:hypothetical protein